MNNQKNINETQWRLSKFLSLFGSVSRREAEKLCHAGQVKINNELPKNSAIIVTKKDIITMNNRRILASQRTLEEVSQDIIIAIYKPTGLIVTRSDEKNRPTIYTALPKSMENFHYVGRLDINSEGLILFTNNPKIARSLENPHNEVPRIYHVKAHGILDEKKLHRISKGVIIEGESYRPQSIKILPKTKENSSNSWIEIILTQGKNREIRKLLEHFNLQVAKLIRISFGNISIKDFPKESIYTLNTKQKEKLAKFYTK